MKRTLASIALAITLVSAVAFRTPVTQPDEAKVAKSKPIKVMSFNIRYGTARDGDNEWRHRSYLVAETIRLFDPDLLGAQEVLEFQRRFLEELLPNYGFHGVGRQDGRTKGEYVPVMYKKDRFRVIESGHFWLSETPEAAGSRSWDSSLPRMASWVRLRDVKNGDAELVFLNTHFDHRGPTARLESARLIRRRAEGFMAQGIPVIITGDFNTNEDGQPYAELTAGAAEGKTPIVDSYRRANPERSPNESTFSHWVGQRKGSRIDWVLHSPEFTTLRSVIDYTNDGGRYPSDHYPVAAVLRLND